MCNVAINIALHNCGLWGLVLPNQAPGKHWFASLWKCHMVWGISASLFRVSGSEHYYMHRVLSLYCLCWARERKSKMQKASRISLLMSPHLKRSLFGEKKLQNLQEVRDRDRSCFWTVSEDVHRCLFSMVACINRQIIRRKQICAPKHDVLLTCKPNYC